MKLSKVAAKIEEYQSHDYFIWWREYLTKDWFLRMCDHHELKVVSSLLHHLSSFTAYKEYCRGKDSSIDPILCAAAHIFMKKQWEFDVYNDKRGKPILDHDSKVVSEIQVIHWIHEAKRYVPKVENLGILFFMLGVRID